jgi:hypothetical protein
MINYSYLVFVFAVDQVSAGLPVDAVEMLREIGGEAGCLILPGKQQVQIMYAFVVFYINLYT